MNAPLCVASGDQGFPFIVSDDAGGAIVVWSAPLSAQRVSASGAVLWPSNGVALCTVAGSPEAPVIVSDGASGAIVAWTDYRGGGTSCDIYAQRISAGGAIQWQAGGVPLCTAVAQQLNQRIASDGAGGAIVTWTDSRSGNGDIYAQRVSAGGTALWTVNGVPLCTAAGDQQSPAVVSDGSGGAIVTWTGPSSGGGQVYAQRVAADGSTLWPANGVALCAVSALQLYPAIVSDGDGGAIVAWGDYRSGGDIYAQRVSASGTLLWTDNGVPLCTATGSQYIPTSISDGVGGAFVVWYDVRTGTNYDLYAQRVSGGGAVQWALDGVAICTAAGEQKNYPSIVPDGAGGAIIGWGDPRNGNGDIWAQRVSGNGVVQWTPDGVAICSAATQQGAPRIASDGVGGAIVGWNDLRSGNRDIYAQRVQANGQLGGDTADVPPGAVFAFALDPVRPNPSDGAPLSVQFVLTDGLPASLELLDVAGRRLAGREVGPLGPGRHAIDLGEGLRLAPGIYMVRLARGPQARVRRVAILR